MIVQSISCDGCGQRGTDPGPMSGPKIQAARLELREKGWSAERRGVYRSDYCPTCTARRSAAAKAA